MKRSPTVPSLFLALLVALAGCRRAEQVPPPTLGANPGLTITVLYPLESTEIEMGQTLKGLVKVVDLDGRVVDGAHVTATIKDPSGKLLAELPHAFGAGDVYRSDAWIIPHRMQPGIWTMDLEARSVDGGHGSALAKFNVLDSTSEILLNKYGFWIDSPAFASLVPTLSKEQGDARNGVIVWGGLIPAQHIFRESWIQVHWREGKANLETAEDVRTFMRSELGDLGYSPLRDLGPFEQTVFKGWQGWKVKARGLFLRYDWQWYVFFAPEVDKTYALGSLVVLAPVDGDPHERLSGSFEVHPEIQTPGSAPEPLPHLLPPPEPVAPPIGTRFNGTDQPITLSWKPVKELAADEYYQVSVDYNYTEANPAILYSTRETHFTLPTLLYGLPNCGIFNWKTTLMRRTGTAPDGQPEGEALSFSSLYWYVEWRYPSGVEAPFKPLCPNPQV